MRGSFGAVIGTIAGVLAGGVGGLGGSLAMGQQAVRYDFSQVTSLCQQAVAGTNVDTPIPGFDVQIIKDGRIVYHRAFGVWTLNRVANADSATKTLSGAAIVSLLDSSAVPGFSGAPFSLDTTLSDYIPAFSGDKSGVTIRQSFSHSSGLAAGPLVLSNPNITLQQAAASIAGTPLDYLPGEAFLYGGASMHAAGAVAELAGGQPWNTLFQQRIAGPLGLSVTRFVLSSPSNPRIAGGCESNATEFGRFMEMLRRGGVHNPVIGAPVRVLSQNAVNAMFTRQSPVGVPVLGTPYENISDYGVGVWLDERDAQGNLIGAIAAGARGFASWIDFDDATVGVFATDQSNSGNAQPLYRMLRAAIQDAVRNPLACEADFNQNGFVGTQDIFDFLSAWFAGDAAADINEQGGVSVQDIFDFLALWFAGC